MESMQFKGTYLSISWSTEKGYTLFKQLFCLSSLYHVLNSATLASRTFGAFLHLNKLSSLFASVVCLARVWNSPTLTLHTKDLKDLQYLNVWMSIPNLLANRTRLHALVLPQRAPHLPPLNSIGMQLYSSTHLVAHPLTFMRKQYPPYTIPPPW